jgi:hypothetical protein
LGVLTRQLTSQEYTKRIVTEAKGFRAKRFFLSLNLCIERRLIMKRNLERHSSVVSITRSMDKGNQIQRFFRWEKHPRQKHSPFAESVHRDLPIRLVF